MRPASQPTISVVTPSFNQGVFIAETIDSVLGQDYERLEYLVVDGGSTDETLDVLRRYGDRVRWLSEPDEGQSAAINKGWRLTRGEIISWLNADDLYLPGAVSEIMTFFDTHPDVDLVYGDCDYIDRGGRVVRPYPTRPYDYLDLLRSAINYIPQPATFLRRRALETVGFLDESLHYAMDLEFWLRVGRCCQAAYLPRRLALTRLHSDAKSVRHAAGFGPELVRVFERLFAQPDLPQPVRSVEREAMGSVYYLAATRCFWEGDPREAVQYAKLAWDLVGGRRRRALLLLLGLGRLGSVGVAAAGAVRRVFPRAS